MEEQFESWAVLEIMGHRRLGGHVRAVTLAGANFLRIDAFDAAGAEPYATQYYPPSAVYCLTPTTEAVARHVGESNKPRPPAPRLGIELEQGGDRREDDYSPDPDDDGNLL